MLTNIINDLVELVYKLVTTITDTDCVAVRLRDNNGNFPLHSGIGHGDNVKKRKCLKRLDDLDMDYRNCICGMVILNNHAPIQEFFTKYGTFWNSDIGKEFLDRLDSRLLVGKSCLSDGIKSLAVVPLKDHERCEGVFHVSDQDAGKFDADKIRRLEEISLYFTQIVLKIEKSLAENKSRKYTIVIADDEPAISALIKNVLCRFGHNCYQADNGVEALKLVSARRVDLLITDLNMPHMTGDVLIKTIREKYDIYGPEIIILSGYLSDVPEGFMKSYRVSSVLAKPLEDIFEIPRIVERVFQEAG